VAEAAPEKDLGEEGLVPELPLLPDGEAYSVQSEASEPLLMVMVSEELPAIAPLAS